MNWFAMRLNCFVHVFSLFIYLLHKSPSTLTCQKFPNDKVAAYNSNRHRHKPHRNQSSSSIQSLDRNQLAVNWRRFVSNVCNWKRFKKLSNNSWTNNKKNNQKRKLFNIQMKCLLLLLMFFFFIMDREVRKGERFLFAPSLDIQLVSHVWIKKHKIWMRSFLFIRWYRVWG